MEIRYSKSSLKFLAKQEKSKRERIRKAIEQLTLDPPKGDIKPLKGYSDDRKRLRIGSVRVIFRITSEGEIKILSVIDIDNRGDVYK